MKIFVERLIIIDSISALESEGKEFNEDYSCKIYNAAILPRINERPDQPLPDLPNRLHP